MASIVCLLQREEIIPLQEDHDRVVDPGVVYVTETKEGFIVFRQGSYLCLPRQHTCSEQFQGEFNLQPAPRIS